MHTKWFYSNSGIDKTCLVLILVKIHSLQHMKTIEEYNFKVEVTSDILVYITIVKNDYSEDRGDIGFREQSVRY